MTGPNKRIDGTDPSPVAEVAPARSLRMAINSRNFLPVAGTARNGDPVDMSPGIAAEIARRPGVGITFLTEPDPGSLADGATPGDRDICDTGADPPGLPIIRAAP